QPVAGATSQTFTATVEGNYAVIVTVGNCTDTSNCVVAGYASIETTEGFSIQLYPNPARNFIQIQSSDLIQNIECLDLQGKLVRVYTANSLQFTMNVSELKNGIYIFGIKTNKGLIYKRIVVFHE
ncbi:MAG: T9SS type A sorting domain-containing protein, partial [Flavobacteriales bacterium]|nr:T9SS type A sorting domain-containing protein [Flavobacteriales bacterium]